MDRPSITNYYLPTCPPTYYSLSLLEDPPSLCLHFYGFFLMYRRRRFRYSSGKPVLTSYSLLCFTCSSISLSDIWNCLSETYPSLTSFLVQSVLLVPLVFTFLPSRFIYTFLFLSVGPVDISLPTHILLTLLHFDPSPIPFTCLVWCDTSDKISLTWNQSQQDLEDWSYIIPFSLFLFRVCNLSLL